jgi:hypothetical protein
MRNPRADLRVATSEGGAFVVVAARLGNHEWTMNFTPDDARDLATKLNEAADEVDRDMG